MCVECGRTFGCSSSCPNAPEPDAVYICDGCGYGIYDGDFYWEFDEKKYCETCVDDVRGVACE